MRLRLKDIIIGGIIISVVGGLAGGLIHTILDNKKVRNRIEGICMVVGKKEEGECKKIIDSALNMTDEDFQGYVSNGGSGE